MNTDDDKTTDQTEDQGPDTTAEAPETPAGDQETAGQSGDNVTVTEQSEASDTEEQAGEDTSETPPEGDTFPRAYVEELRQEAAGYRTRVKDLETKLHRLQVEQTGALADPADLEFDAAHLEDPEALQAAIEELLAAKPHLKARRFAPDAAAQGAKASASSGVDLLGILRQNA
ncbi:hypothetical protein [Gordonia sihwensis]|uniref:hypothetical protein n=1 Tax=Gordonia sihwensis TaxID=173559 RepID=UPI0005F0000C|nr:hypothetical protein [Gordonia sihwensis]KJR08440.1 hypothetical protein UG54_07655 [Gordonia sihwensis]